MDSKNTIQKQKGLIQACKEGNYDRVVYLLEVVRVDALLGATALEYANQSRNKQLVQYLERKIEEIQKSKKNNLSSKVKVKAKAKSPSKFVSSALPTLEVDDVYSQSVLDSVEDSIEETVPFSKNISQKLPPSFSNSNEDNQEELTPDIAALKNLFPDISVDILQVVLQDSQGSLDFAVELLLNGSYGETQELKIEKTYSQFLTSTPKDFPTLPSKKKKNKPKKKKTSDSSRELLSQNSSDLKVEQNSLSETNLKTLESQEKKETVNNDVVIDEENYEYIEEYEDWSQIDDDESDIDIQSIAETVESEQISDDWDIYFPTISPENDNWETLENPENAPRKLDEEDWIVKEDLEKSYAVAVLSPPRDSTPNKSLPKDNSKINMIQKKTPEKIISFEESQKNEKIKKSEQMEYTPNDEFYITKEGRVYGKATKTTKGSSNKPPVKKSGKPAGFTAM